MPIHSCTGARRARGVERGSFALTLLLKFLCVSLGIPSVWAQQSLTLDDALQRSLSNNPALQVFQWRFEAIEGARQAADLAPAYNLGLESENVLGSGDYSGTDRAELTLSLSSIVELGGARRSRVSVADARYALAQTEREASALDLLGDVTQGFVVALTLQEKQQIAKEASALAEATYRIVSKRAERGAAPEAERLRAQAAQTQARLREASINAALASQKLALATLWGDEVTNFDALSGDLFQLAEADSFDALMLRVAETPALRVFASEARLRDAEVALARSQSRSTLEWSVGVRHFEESGDSAFTAGISMPLFGERRNRGAVQTALAERERVGYSRQAALLVLRARLFEAWQTYQHNVAAVRLMRTEMLPALESALVQTREGYEKGRYSYIDWVSAQRELLDARMALIDAASTALLNQALIEQLTAHSLTTPSLTTSNATGQR